MGTELMPGGQSGPALGAQFAQLVKELRSEYGGAVTACAARIAAGVFNAPPGRSILRILQQHGITGTPTLMQQQVGPGGVRLFIVASLQHAVLVRLSPRMHTPSEMRLHPLLYKGPRWSRTGRK